MPKYALGALFFALLSGCAGPQSSPSSPAPADPDQVSVACKNARVRFRALCNSPGLPSNMVTPTAGCLAANDDVHRFCD